MPQPIRLTRHQLARRLIQRGTARSRDTADDMVHAVLTEIADALRAEKVVMLSGFGTFQVKPTGERKIQKKRVFTYR